MTAPTCVTCKKPLPKRTDTIYFKDPRNTHGFISAIPADVRSKEEVQRHTNKTIISVRKSSDGRVRSANIWDGSSYGPAQQHGLFCTGACAQAFGIAMAKRMIADGRIKR